MNSKATINPPPENVLQNSWNSITSKTKFLTTNGDEIIILFPGRWNFEEGPDFISAKISVDNTEIVGDIEIHRFQEDWIKHGHCDDKRYNNVILHVIGALSKSKLLNNNKISLLPTIVLPDFFVQDFKHDDSKKYNYGYCASKFSRLSDETLHLFFKSTGEKRFLDKTVKMTEEILRYGVETTFLKYFFESCGYKKNRNEFIELFNRFSEYNIEDCSQHDINAILWGESGLLPDPADKPELSADMDDFIEQVWNIWWSERKVNSEKITWHLSGVRPLNSPCRRLAAISCFISKFSAKPFGMILKEFNKVSDLSSIWKVFRKESVLSMDFYHKDEFEAKFPNVKLIYPTVLKLEAHQLSTVLTDNVLNEISDVNELIERLKLEL
jgi:hypothetical protein